MGSIALYECAGGVLTLPAQGVLLADRADGGNLVVNPPRDVWERSALSCAELTAWAHLVAAAGEAMLSALPALEGGCINYWEAGNWALNDAAAPKGPKTAPMHRSVHLHLIGRSRFAKSPHHVWGEAPRFPAYADRLAWAADHKRLTPDESVAVVAKTDTVLREKFGMRDRDGWRVCDECAYPTPAGSHHACGEPT